MSIVVENDLVSYIWNCYDVGKKNMGNLDTNILLALYNIFHAVVYSNAIII